MDIKQEAENLLKTARLYQSQGLYKEARNAYQTALELIKSNDQIKNKESILSDLSQKIRMLDDTEAQVESAPATQELPDSVQNLIKNLFSFSEKKDVDTKALSEAVTLAKFGQLERAIGDLTKLLDKKSVRVAAAKNILRCHMLMSGSDKAVNAYEQWVAENKFLPEEIKTIRNLLEHQLAKNGIQKPLPEVTSEAVKETVPVEANIGKMDMLDIGSVLINFDQGPLKGKPIEFDVHFQTGNTVSLLIESKEKNLLDTLSIGFRLREVQYRSSVAIFRGTGVVSAKIKIHEGPKRGDYHLDIRIQEK